MEDQRRIALRLIWRALALLAVVTVLILILDPILRRRELRKSGGTSFGTTPGGFRGVLEVAGRLGFRTERFRNSYVSLPPPEESVLLVLDPKPWTQILGKKNWSVLRTYGELASSWVDSGGVLIYAPASRSLGGVLGFDIVVPVDDDIAGEDTAPEDLPEPGGLIPVDELAAKLGSFDPFGELLTEAPLLKWIPPEGRVQGAGPLENEEWELLPLSEDLRRPMRGYLGPKPLKKPLMAGFEDPGSSPFQGLLLLEGVPIAVEQAVGEGRLIAFSDPYLWTNGAVGTADGAIPIMRLLQWASDGGSRTLYFDEYIHGLGVRRGALRWLWETDLFTVVATAALGIGLFIWRGAIRFGPPVEPRVIPRRAKEEFVVALGDIYSRAQRRRLAAELVLRGHEEELASLMGMEAEAPRARRGPREFEELRRMVSRGGPDGSASLLRFARRARAAFTRARSFLQTRRGQDR